MKKIFSALCLILLLTSISASANNNCISWFVKSVDDHLQPNLMDGGKTYDEYDVLSIGNADEKVIYLTFDAGYENGNVAKILDILKKQNVKATFFILPAIIKFNTDIVIRIHDEGHIVANHTYSHKNISSMSKGELTNELENLEDIYHDRTGNILSKYFRPPEGSFSEQSLQYLKELGYRTVFWSFAYVDWDNGNQKPLQWAYDKIMSNVHNGMVMLLHPNSTTNAAILDDVIIALKVQGYRFETLDYLYNHR
ncbi:MAG: hypothetical protein A2Y17_03190 [Clostridiales bacterium GWF2_38_85]|nr:MAG: hypothetical protein A2Y17_03190 [Clostridiales bacterium GWF2_38_85]